MTTEETPNEAAVRKAADALSAIIDDLVGSEVDRFRKNLNYTAIKIDEGVLYGGALPNRSTEVEIKQNANLKNNNFVADIAKKDGRITAGRVDLNSPIEGDYDDSNSIFY